MINPVFPDLKGKSCVITGGAGILGRAMCEALAEQGVRLCIVGRDAAKAGALASDLSARYKNEAFGVSCDVTDEDALIKLQTELRGRFGHLDLLVNGAGGNDPSSVSKMEQLFPREGTKGTSSEDYDLSGSFFDLDQTGFAKVFGLNFTGTLLPIKVLGQDMLGKGSILNISSVSALLPLTKVAAYGTAKTAVTNLTQWLSVHLARTGIRVNALVPGFFLTEQNRFLLTEKETGELTERGNKVVRSTPMGRFGTPDELSGAVLYLLSEASAFVTGIVLAVDGGFTAYSGV